MTGTSAVTRYGRHSRVISTFQLFKVATPCSPIALIRAWA